LLTWLEAQRRQGEGVCFDNLSERFGVLMLAGPKARDILAACTQAPLDDACFRWLSAQEITVAGAASLLALRVTYSRALGWDVMRSA
jgi:dimethylglycine dehydrogenase